MAGGNWTAQNKVLPDTYINYSGEGGKPSVIGERGTVGLPITFPWLDEQSIIAISSKEAAKLYTQFGTDALLLKEAAKKAATIYLFRLNKGTRAFTVLGNLTVAAVYSGTYGNRFSVSVEAAAGQPETYYVITWLDDTELERQLVTSISELIGNAWVTFSKTAEENTLVADAGKPLTGGTDGTVTNADQVKALEAFEMRQIDAIACPSSELSVKELYISFAKRMISEEGNYVQMVVADSKVADFESVISVKNGVLLENGTIISNAQATAYIAGATAACPLTESLTGAVYDGAVDVDTRYTRTQQEDLAKSGQLVFLPPALGGTQVTIQKDINSLTTFTDKKTYALSKNKIIRILFTICNAITNIGNRYKGTVPNNENGRSQLKAEILELFRDMESKGILKDVSPDDITAEQGALIDAVVISYQVKPVDVMELFYNSIVVNG